MKKTLSGAFIFISLIALIIVISCPSCSKSPSSSGPGNSATAIWPFKAGNTWVYADSVFSDSTFISYTGDTVTALAQTYHDDDNGGFPLYQLTSTGNGWFFTNSFAGVDPGNDAIFLMDSLNSGGPYLFFAVAPVDGTVIGTGTDFSNPNCPIQIVQYGFATPVVVDGYSCISNVQYSTDCNGVIQEEIFIYVSPGVGVVRIEDWVAVNNVLYLDYSQTLKSVTLAK
jgi:hypothetical protein